MGCVCAFLRHFYFKVASLWRALPVGLLGEYFKIFNIVFYLRFIAVHKLPFHNFFKSQKLGLGTFPPENLALESLSLPEGQQEAGWRAQTHGAWGWLWLPGGAELSGAGAAVDPSLWFCWYQGVCLHVRLLCHAYRPTTEPWPCSAPAFSFKSSVLFRPPRLEPAPPPNVPGC